MNQTSSPGAIAVPDNATLLPEVALLARPGTLVAILQVAAQLMETWLAARQGTAGPG
jgi:hypothetical protein